MREIGRSTSRAGERDREAFFAADQASPMKLTDITVVRTIPASAEKVFDVWVDPMSPGGPWFGAERGILDPVAEGLFHFAVKHEGRTWPHYGRFLRIDRPRLVEYTWVSEATEGVESIVLVTLEPRGEQTELTLRHSGVPDDQMGRQHKEGGTWILSMLAERFASPRSAPPSHLRTGAVPVWVCGAKARSRSRFCAAAAGVPNYDTPSTSPAFAGHPRS